MKTNVKLLAIETSGKSGSVCLLRAVDDTLQFDSETLDAGSGSAKTLAPAIDRLLKRLAVSVKDLTCIALLSGPGSFTGLRVGVATAKALAYALKLPVVEVDTLDAIALQIPHSQPDIHVVLDAYRGQVFYAHYKLEAGGNSSSSWSKVADTQIVDIEQLLGEILPKASDRQIVVCGPGCQRIQKFLADDEHGIATEKLPTDRIKWLDGPETFPQAESVAKLAYRKYLAGETQDAFGINPRYFRGSAAEELATKSLSR